MSVTITSMGRHDLRAAERSLSDLSWCLLKPLGIRSAEIWWTMDSFAEYYMRVRKI